MLIYNTLLISFSFANDLEFLCYDFFIDLTTLPILLPTRELPDLSVHQLTDPG